MVRRETWSGAAQYTHLGITLAMVVIGGFFGGYWIDQKIDTVPLFAIIGTFIGASAGIFSMIRTLNRMRIEMENTQPRIDENDKNG